MGKRGSQVRVKLIIGLIYGDSKEYLAVKPFLLRAFGQIDFESPELSFDHTLYYEPEFGKNLKRRFISFTRLISPSAIADIKIRMNDLEKRRSASGKRRVNIDPGYLDMAKLVLASTKDFCHRLYLDKGIYAEVTLVYRNGGFTTWDWTYPDYRSPEYIDIFNHIRTAYAHQLCSPHT